MAEIAVVGIATSAAKVLAQWVANRAWDEINLGWGFNNELQKLHKKFECIQAFLDDASKNAKESQRVNLWLQKVKDAAYMADNVMDEYSIEIFRRKMEVTSWMECIGTFCTHSNPIIFQIRMAHKVKEIISLFDEIDKEANNIAVNQAVITATAIRTHSDWSETRPYAVANAFEFVGREDEQEKLLDFICSPCNNEETVLSTVAIVGMGGVGKTTLTRHLYDHERISSNFGDKRIWISASQNFDIIRLLNEMVESFTSSKSKLSNIDAIIRKLKKELNRKKLLLVFDDVWADKQDSWRFLKEWLLRIGTLRGSVILINTRNDDVAKAAGAIFKHKLEGLSTDKSWSLLYQIVSDNGIQPIDYSLKEVGKRIVEKCKGVPLAIEVIGGLLRSKHHLHEWEAIEKSELSDLPHVQKQILASLLLSFNHLPYSSAKQCFAYCAIIPKGSCIFKSELIGLWSSQGYLHDDQRKHMTAEEIGEENLKILLSNLLLESVSTESGIVGYRMHELVYDLAANVCGSDLIKDAKDLGKIGSCRHLVINSVENLTPSDLTTETTLEKLRTLSLMGTAISWDALIHARYLRTLMIDRTGITELPPAVAHLKHLRFLDVSHNPISTLPDSIGELYQLQTLVIHSCKNMVKLPKVVNKLVNLRHISTTVPMLAWKGLLQLTNLQNLPPLSLHDDEDGWTIDELGDLHELRDEIHILGIERVKDKEQSKKAGLAGKANVTKLNLFWVEPQERIRINGGNCDEDVLEGLEPHPNITSIEVQNFNGVRFPAWITGMAVLTDGGSVGRTSLKNLTTVKLLNCTRCQTLPRLGQLPLLKSLMLSGLYVECIDIEFYGGDDLYMPEAVSFQCLRELDISGFCRLTTWREPPKASFPSLETLRVRDCDLLESVPVLGITSLTSLELRNLKSVESLDIIKYSLGLTSLIMSMLPKIESLPQELADCWKLQTLHISDFHKLASMPSGLESLVNLKSKLVNVRDISAIAPILTLEESHQQSLPLLSLDNDDVCTINDLEDLYPLSDKFPILGPECATAEEQVGKGLESAEGVEQARNSLECVVDMNLAGTNLESAKGEDLTGKSLEDVPDNELTEKSVECAIDKELSLACIEANWTVGTSQSFEVVEEEELAGKSLEGAKDEELAGHSLHCVNYDELVGKSHESVEGAGIIVECVKDEEIAGKGLEGIEDREIAGESFELVEDEENLVAWRAKVNNSWVNGSGFQQLTNLGEFEDELRITGLECIKDKEKARKVGLAGKANITLLNLVWTEGRGETSDGVWDEDVLEALEPHPNITSLKIHNFLGVKFPPWIMDMVKWTTLENLTEVELMNCSRCQTLPTLGHLPRLKKLVLSGFDVETVGTEFYGYYDLDLPEVLFPKSLEDSTSMVPQAVSFRSLLKLHISGFCRLTTWSEPPKTAFPCLEYLRIRDCSRLESVPALASKTLRDLTLENLDTVRSLDIIKVYQRLTSLILSGLPNLESLPEELSYCTKLLELEVSSAHKLSHMPNGLKSLANLYSMTVSEGRVINFVMVDLLHVRLSLRLLAISLCPMLVKIPSGLQECTSLKRVISENSLMSQGSINISKFERLFYLGIICSSHEHLRSVLESAEGHRRLSALQIEGFRDRIEMQEYFYDIAPFFRLPSLRHLLLRGRPNIDTLPRKLGLLTQITTLHVEQFEDLEGIPTWICNLSSLRNLVIVDCKNLKYLPSKEDLKLLYLLQISGCPLLVKRCVKDEGPEWQNISHIRRIVLDSVVIQE